MSARFSGNRKIAAGFFPLSAVGCETASASAELREKMRQLMSQRPIDFMPVLTQAGIQRDNLSSEISPACRARETRIPFHAHVQGKLTGT
jgi:hypothetical protein